MELWLIRHPRPEGAEGICYGRLDLPVAEPEAEAAAARLSGLLPAIHSLHSSPAGRCRALARRLHARPVEDERLQERHFGRWEGLTWDDIGREALDAWAAEPWDFAPPGGESARTLVERVGEVLAETVGTGGTHIWVTHQGVARAAAAILLRLSAGTWMTLQLPFGSAWQLVDDNGIWRLFEWGTPRGALQPRKKEIAAGD